MEHGDFVGLGHDRLQELAGTLHRLPGGQYTSAPIYGGSGPGHFPPAQGGPVFPVGLGPGHGPRLPFRTEQGPRNFGQFRRQFNLNRQLLHPVDQFLPADHGIHPAAVQLLRDQYDNDLLQAAAQQGGLY
jgi:hypothetical protein